MGVYAEAAVHSLDVWPVIRLLPGQFGDPFQRIGHHCEYFIQAWTWHLIASRAFWGPLVDWRVSSNVGACNKNEYEYLSLGPQSFENGLLFYAYMYIHL